MRESRKVTRNSTRILGTASSFIASRGANFSPVLGTGGVWGRVNEKSARRIDAIPETIKPLVKAASIDAPVFTVESALPSQATNPPASLMEGTAAQSIGMKTKGQAAAIQPIVPQTRTIPKSFCASLRLAKAIALVTERVGT